MLIILPDKSMKMLPPDPIRIDEILLLLGFNPSAVIVVRNNAIVPDDLVADGDDEIRIIQVSHGG